MLLFFRSKTITCLQKNTPYGKLSVGKCHNVYMYRYKYNTSYHHKSRKARRTTKLAVVLSILMLGAGIYIVYDMYKQDSRTDAPVSQATSSTVQGASINLFRTEYFQFQTDSNWKEIPGETKSNKFVYRSFNGPLVEHDITIEVNPAPEVMALSKTTHVMPVQIESTGRLSIVDGPGDHCNKNVPKTEARVPLRVTQRQVNFICSIDAVIYQVQVGVVGGSTDMSITRPDGTKAVYRITYRNLKFTPDDNMIRNIITTFQAR
jgi:hypothetical protein